MANSNIGRALEKIIGQGFEGAISDTRYDNTTRQRRFEYEDGVIARGLESKEQIKRMSQPFLFNREELVAHKIVHQGDYNTAALEVLQNLRNRIVIKNNGLGATTLVTSVGESDEPIFLARSLAAILSTDESKTSLLLELRETGSRLTGSRDEKPGLSDFVYDESRAVKDVLHPTGVPRTRIIPFGTHEFLGHEYLRSTRLRMLIKDITRRYPRERFSVIDAPAVDKVPDVELLNEYADQILLCVPYGRVSDKDIGHALSRLDKDKLIGTVVVGMPRMRGLIGRLAR
ncbi:MAG: tyrosine-protein kinase family protein [Thiotrichales bacterium]